MQAVPLHYVEGGHGPPVLVLHGLFGSSSNWRSFAKKLAASMRVIVPDLRNHGRSPHADVHDYPSMAADLIALLDRLGIMRSALVGHSMGGKAAMELALTRPGRATRMAALDITPHATRNGAREVLDALLKADLSEVRSREEVDVQLATQIGDPRVRTFLLMGLAREDGAYRWRFNLDAIASNWSSIAGEVTHGVYEGPALFLRGELSDYVSEADVPPILERFPHAHIDSIPGAGHWVHVDAPEETLRKLGDFLAPGARHPHP